MLSKIEVGGVNPAIRDLVRKYTEEAIHIFGENLRSIILFGSALEEGFCLRNSNINLILILHAIDAYVLERAFSLVRKGMKKKIVAPLCFTEEHIELSKDSFPMELLEIKEQHLALYGGDPFVAIEVPAAGLRLECEHQVKGMLVRLRQSFLELGPRAKGIDRLLLSSFSSLLPVFRTILRLRRESIPQDKEALIKRISELLCLDSEVFLKLLRHKEKREMIRPEGAVEFFNRYLHELTSLSLKIDHMAI
ncbi:MAG: hypothetical protein PHE61_04410 [Candidatus Omnitrophica bacterium]|nr:hypothetical protein [Candidatus Omnitrophota bacterium]